MTGSGPAPPHRMPLPQLACSAPRIKVSNLKPSGAAATASRPEVAAVMATAPVAPATLSPAAGCGASGSGESEPGLAVVTFKLLSEPGLVDSDRAQSKVTGLVSLSAIGLPDSTGDPQYAGLCLAAAGLARG